MVFNMVRLCVDGMIGTDNRTGALFRGLGSVTSARRRQDMSDHIYLIDSDGGLHPMPESRFPKEDVFQAMLEQHPDLLMTGGGKPSWLLITREMPVADTDSGANRWSLDHLFLDQDSVPTLVEVKRSTDTRLRREVVGQMLDYAANAVVHWSVDRIIAELEKRCEREKTDLQAIVTEHLQVPEDDGLEEAVEKFWSIVRTNLDAEKIRLVFVADIIPSELQRIIEFLNNQMTPAEVLGVELKLYQTDQFKTLVPRLVGQTEKAQHKKGAYKSGPPRDWDKDQLLQEIEQNAGHEIRKIANEMLDWMRNIAKPAELNWGRGAKIGFVYLVQDYRGKVVQCFALNTKGKITLTIDTFPDDPGTRKMLTEFVDRINTIPGIEFPPADKPTYRNYLLNDLSSAQLDQIKQAVVWLVDHIRANTTT
ncbi:MAG: hypothetical protein D6816_11420 [Bacteroidetes bacterium]|nr:MAG: hypothetical protein D6816_11420 [Bacteroidota bacterium]